MVKAAKKIHKNFSTPKPNMALIVDDMLPRNLELCHPHRVVSSEVMHVFMMISFTSVRLISFPISFMVDGKHNGVRANTTFSLHFYPVERQSLASSALFRLPLVATKVVTINLPP